MYSTQDTELMVRAAQGSREAFSRLFDIYYPRAVNIAYRALGNRDLAEDIAMEAFSRIYERRDKYRPDAQFSTYLYRVVVNLAINASRNRKHDSAGDMDINMIAAGPETDPVDISTKSETAAYVRKAILDLPENQRMAVILVKYESLSYESAASAMGVTVKALESLLHRAKTNLKKALADYVSEK